MNSLTVHILQTEAGGEPEVNLSSLERRIARLGKGDLIVLPEVFAGRGDDDDYDRWAEPIPGPLTERLGGVARERGVWLLAGSMVESAAKGKPHNSSVLFDRHGRIRAVYRKMHLFEARLDNGVTIRESDTFAAGSSPVLVEIDGWRCGLAICYDLRFPELFRHYSHRGANILLVPSNFTQRTGKDHWEVLLRARAIENQCYVVAPNQCGTNPATGVVSYGHSMAVDPWGTVLASAAGRETVLSVTLDPAAMKEIRAQIPVLRHRRPGL